MANAQDYVLFLLAGVVNKNLGRLAGALELYKTAIQADPGQLRAWQGAFEIISHPEWKASPGEFDMSVVEKLLARYVQLFLLLPPITCSHICYSFQCYRPSKALSLSKLADEIAAADEAVGSSYRRGA